MLRVFGTWWVALSAAVAVLFAPAAHAQTADVRITVARSVGSERCPGAEQVIHAVAALFPDNQLRATTLGDASLVISVLIRSTAAGYEAFVSVPGKPRAQRMIADADPNCRGLADALAVALMVMSEGEAPPKAPAPAPPAPPAPVAPPEAPPAKGAARTRFAAEAAAFGGLGVLDEPALGGVVGVSLFSRWGVGGRIRGLRAIAETKALDAGETQVDLWAALIGACYRVALPGEAGFIPCLDLGYGRQHGESRGLLVQSGEASGRWLVLGPSVSFTLPLVGPFGAGATLGMSARLHHQTFSVDGAKVEDAPPVGGYATLGVQVAWPNSGSGIGE